MCGALVSGCMHARACMHACVHANGASHNTRPSPDCAAHALGDNVFQLGGPPAGACRCSCTCGWMSPGVLACIIAHARACAHARCAHTRLHPASQPHPLHTGARISALTSTLHRACAHGMANQNSHTRDFIPADPGHPARERPEGAQGLQGQRALHGCVAVRGACLPRCTSMTGWPVGRMGVGTHAASPFMAWVEAQVPCIKAPP